MHCLLSILLNCEICQVKYIRNAKGTTEFKKQQIQEKRLTKVIKHNAVDSVFR